MKSLQSPKSVRLLIVLMLGLVCDVYAWTPAPAPPSGMTNLSKGKPYTISQLVSTQYTYASSESSYYLKGALTDGYIGSSGTFADGQWQGYLHGGARTVIIDMGQVNTVEQIQEKFIHDPSAGIWFPRHVTYALSLNDTDWANVGTVNSSIPLTTTSVEVQSYAVSGFNYEARYVKMTFPVDVWVFADEFQVFGQLGVLDSATIPPITPPTTYPNAYCPPGSPSVGGTKNMVLIYNGYYASQPSLADNTVDDLTPYVGYESTAGKITDFMFDGFLFLPYVAGAPSGGIYYCDTAHPTVESDWVYYLDNTFDSTYNLSALNVAVGNVKKALSDSSYQAKVEIAIPYPTPTATNFGVIGGDSINLTYLPDREKVIKWYIDQVIARWDMAAYSNLDLVGFYWYQEGAEFEVNDSETEMLQYAGNYVRSLGKVLDWIPSYQASGFADWDSLGFDAAIMQPNYAFNNWPEGELGEAADAIKKLGMGIEIEIHWDALSSSQYRDKYYAYLNYGATKGYMTGAVHMYYQNGGPGTFYDCAVSSDPALRNIYDQTYDFIKGTYIPTSVEGEGALPRGFRLFQNYPNPFNPTTKIQYSLSTPGMVSLKIYDTLGQRVKELTNQYETPGSYVVNFNASNLASGVYFYRLSVTVGSKQGSNYSITRKMMFLK